MQKLTTLLAFALFGAAIWVISREVNRVGVGALWDAFEAISGLRLLAAVTTTALIYCLLSTYDLLAFAYIRHPLERRRILFAAFLGYAFSNSISMTPSIAVRFRIYSHWGVSAADFSRVIFFHLMSTWVGFLGVGGTIFLLEPGPVAAAQFITLEQRRWVGLLMWAILGAYVVFAALRTRPVVVKGHALALPSVRLLAAQLAVATADWTMMGLVLYLLLPDPGSMNYFSFLSAFFIAQIIQIVSHVPGGVGVFEGTLLLLLKPVFPTAPLLASLLAYRTIYTVLPLLVALPMMLRFELKARVERRGDGNARPAA